MKKLLLTIISCLTILLYIPFNTFANEYNDNFLNIITQEQNITLQEIFKNSDNFSNFYIHIATNNLIVYSNDLIYSNTNVKLNNYFVINSDGSISYYNNSTALNITDTPNKIIYLKYNSDVIYKNLYLNYSTNSQNYILNSMSIENIERNQYCKPVTSSLTRCYSIIDYDIKYTIKGNNFDVYYLYDNIYRKIQSNINSFTIYSHNSKDNFKDSSSPNNYPDYPTLPNVSNTIYQSSFKLNNFYFVLNDEINLDSILVEAPETDKILVSGNSNSQSSVNNNNDSNQLLDNTVNQMESLENGFKNDLNSNLNNINANDFNISGITQLSNAANFVRVQFDNLTKNNPFGTILGFSLFLGLSLLIIGKRL